MDIVLSDVEVRILGCLIEKERTTPDYYPLTLKALTSACNQKSNREPVVSYEETTVVRGLESLQQKEMVQKIYKADSRVPKYQHVFSEKLGLSSGKTAVICVLMLRGPQTAGEVRGRSERLYSFEGLSEVDAVLTELMSAVDPMVIKLPRQAGRKERRYVHLLSGAPEIQEVDLSAPEEAATKQVRAENERIEKLEHELSELRKEFDELKDEFNELRSQLE
jgi:hypothetical protein